MKAFVLVLVLLCLATGAFAFDIGVGASGSYFMSDMKITSAGLTSAGLETGIPFNFLAFVDLGNIQLAAGYRMVNGFHIKSTSPSGTVTNSDDTTSSYSYLTLAAYGKLPIPLGSITLFPMIGVEYDLTLAATSSTGATATSQQRSDLSSLWIKGGLGADIPVSPGFYVRPELLVGYQLNNQMEKDAITLLKLLGASDASILDLNFELAVLFGVTI
jgi:hypothetical protein